MVTCTKKPKFLASKEVHSFCTSLKCMSMWSCHWAMKCNIEPLGKSGDIKTPLKFAGKVILQIQEQALNKIQKTLRKAEGKVGKTSYGKKLNFQFFWIFDRLMKTLISQHFAQCARNSPLLCSARCTVNKICK